MTAPVIPATYLDERIAEAEREVTFLSAAYDELRDGTRHWTAWNDELTCPDRQQAAAEECGDALDSAQRELDELRRQARGGN